MLTNYHTLSYISSLLRVRLRENVIIESFTQEKEQIALRFNKSDDTLVLSCGRVANTLYVRTNFNRGRTNSVDVLEGCLNETILNVRMHPVDRVMVFDLGSGKRIDARFFGAKSNVVLVDESNTIIGAFKDAKNVIGTKPEYRDGEAIYDIDVLRKRVAKPQLATLTTLLKEEFPQLGATLAKEILHRAGISPAVGAMSVTEDQIQSIQRGLGMVLAELTAPNPRVYLFTDPERRGTPAAFSILPLTHLVGVEEERFDDVFEAIRFFIAKRRLHESIDEQKKSLVGKLSQKLSKAKRTIEAVEADLQSNSRAQEYQQFASLLMTNLSRVEPQSGRYAADINGGEIVVPLAKELNPAQNAQRYFEKAKRSRAAQLQSTERLAELRRSIAPAKRLLELLDDVTTKEGLKLFMSDNKDELEEFGIGEKSAKREQLPFRVFLVDGGFEVWAGKSSKNNDQLTLKYAKPNDLWFHARGAAGSHVVLKVNTGKGEPGKKAKEQAASIAAYYSKMKNAKMVPVAMTEKKYVRKPKGSAAGSVTIEREKVLFAEPMLPKEKV